MSYLNQYRLMHAVQELSTTDKNIDEIAIDSGFSSSHAFVSLFKKQYDMLPKEYRKEQKSNKKNSHQQIEQHNYIAGLKKYLINDISSNVTTPTADRIIDFFRFRKYDTSDKHLEKNDDCRSRKRCTDK